jgi:hypothetical protein
MLLYILCLTFIFCFVEYLNHMDYVDNEDLMLLQYLYRMAVAKILFIINLVLVSSRRLKRKRFAMSRELVNEREMIRESMLRALSNDTTCRNTCRMGTTAFLNLCNILRRDGGLQLIYTTCKYRKVSC